MIKFLFISGISFCLGSFQDFQPPLGKIEIQFDHYCSRSTEQSKADNLKKNLLPKNPIIGTGITNNRNYTFEEFNNLEYDDLINIIVTLEWWDIDGLFEFSEESYEFYSDTDRMQALFNAVEERGYNYSTDNHFFSWMFSKTTYR